MSTVTLAQLHYDRAADEELAAAHSTEDATGCCARCGRPAPCDVRLDAHNRLANRLYAEVSHL